MSKTSAKYEFDGLQCFNLGTKRMQAGFEIASLLIEILPNEFLSKAPDASLVDAMAYELLRLYVASQAEWEWNGYEWKGRDPEDLVLHLNNPPKVVNSNNGKSVPKANRTRYECEITLESGISTRESGLPEKDLFEPDARYDKSAN